MSHEIVCPHCNKAFTVDEAGYAAIVSQVRNSEYQRDLERERRNLEDSLEARISLALAKTEKEYGEKLSQKEEELSSLRTSSLIEKEKLEGSLKALRDSFDSERRNLSLQSDTRIKEYEARLERRARTGKGIWSALGMKKTERFLPSMRKSGAQRERRPWL